MISLRFTGTGALGNFRCKNKLSKDYRRFPSLLIDEKIIIDPSEDLFEFEESFMLYGIIDNVKDILITHSHVGHFSINAIEKLAKRGGVRVYAHPTLKEYVSAIPGTSFIPLYEFSPVKVGDYDIIPCPSNHRTDIPAEVCFNFYINREKSIFYGLDGGWISPKTFEVLKRAPCSVYVLDCKEGNSAYGEGSVYHNNFSSCVAIADILKSAGAVSENTKFILSHLPSVKRVSLHEELNLLVENMPDVKVAYDGYYLCI